MDLQNTFYVMGIVFMSINILILIGIIVLVFYMKVKIDKIQRQIEEKIEDFNTFVTNPVRKAADIASSLFSSRSKKSRK